ncbi:dirigent protein 21-like [Primulina huaijiensis]|uniref:dirigent protein 21-like n=1 Tax=Primulina huaijiensis TaxID=1492673 RepID=UPI003CC777F7
MSNLTVVVILMLSSLMISIPNSSAKEHGKDEDLEWFQKLCQQKEEVTKLHFFVQNKLAGENRTVYQVANSSITSSSPTSFGLVVVVDDLLTVGHEEDSGELGRFQGLITSSDLKTVALTININIVFTSGKYNGSTLSIFGRNQLQDATVRELPVVGGTGVFRMARGFAIASTFSSFNATTGSDVLEYTIYVSHH